MILLPLAARDDDTIYRHGLYLPKTARLGSLRDFGTANSPNGVLVFNESS
jgi:hypothetical protein